MKYGYSGGWKMRCMRKGENATRGDGRYCVPQVR